jgi:hypothetical protein
LLNSLIEDRSRNSPLAHRRERPHHRTSDVLDAAVRPVGRRAARRRQMVIGLLLIDVVRLHPDRSRLAEVPVRVPHDACLLGTANVHRKHIKKPQILSKIGLQC